MSGILNKYIILRKGKLTNHNKGNDFILGGLFDISESKQEVAFRYAVERINSNRKILPKSLVSAQIEKIPPQDSFHASKRGKSVLNNSQLGQDLKI